MLKIKDNVDLKELEKFGFIKREDNCWVLKVYLRNADDDKNFYEIAEKDRIIKLTRLDGELDSTLYDLIKADLVEKVAENTEVCDLYETEVSRAIKKLRTGYYDFEGER